MAWLAEMGGAPTEPLGEGAAEFALEFDEVLAVLGTLLHSAPHRHGRTLATHQLFFLELGGLLLGSLAVLHSSEVRLLALEALVVGQLV